MKFPKHFQLLTGLILGGVLGLLLHPYADLPWIHQLSTQVFAPLGKIFLKLIFMIVIPMVFSAMALGVFELGRNRGMGGVLARTLLFTVLASTASVAIGVGLTGLLKPGAGIHLEIPASSMEEIGKIQKNAQVGQSKSIGQILTELVTDNPLFSAVNAFQGEMLPFMVFCLIFGLAMALTVKDENSPLVLVLREVYEITLKIVGFAFALAPFAIFALVFNTALKLGAKPFTSLLYYVGVVVLGLFIQQFVVYALLLRTIAGRSPWQFFTACREVYLYAFSTASSSATLPRSLELAEHKLSLPKDISRFVLTVGATANQNGTALFEGVTVLFLAQVYGIDLSMSAQIQVVLMSILAGIGTAGIPGGSLPLIMILLGSIGIPPEGLALVLGVDRFLDMCRTTINVSGDLVIAALVSGKPVKT